MTEKHLGNFLNRLFGTAQGDRIKGAKFVATNGITQEDVDSLTGEQVLQAFEAYKRAHEAAGMEYTDDPVEFERDLRGNLKNIIPMSEFFK